MRKGKHEAGQAMVEFALILPVFITILFGILEFGVYFTHSLSVTSAAREGAREGIVCASDVDFSSRVKTKVQNSAPELDASNLNISVSKTGSSSNQDVVVSLDYVAATLTPLGKLLWGSEYHVTSSCTMKIG